MKKDIMKWVAVLLCVCIAGTFVGCSAGLTRHNIGEETFWAEIPSGDDSSRPKEYIDSSEINADIVVIGGDKDLTDKEKELVGKVESDADIEEMVYTAVQADLTLAGFSTSIGIMCNMTTEERSGNIGIYYYDDDYKIFASEEARACGFVEIVDEHSEYVDLFNNEDTIIIADISGAEMLEAVSAGEGDDEDEEIINIYAFNYENIGSYHFIYKNQYIMYYQETETRVKYIVAENLRENYDLTLGSLYDYDTNTYIYDASVYDEYEFHSGESLFSQMDYAQLNQQLQEQVRLQNENGYDVEEFQLVYISPEAVQAYLDSEEEATFFGYSVSALTASFGLGVALKYTENGFVPSTILVEEEDGYNWKSFLIKMGIGVGIILVGAILTPLTGGASFGCALLTISKIAITYALTSALGTLAIGTVTGLIQGKDIKTALCDAGKQGLDSFANGFMIGAAIGTVGVVTGIIKPTACFVGDTPVAVVGAGNAIAYKAIRDIRVGDVVYSYDENTQTTSTQKVVDVFRKQTNVLMHIDLDDETIETTENHPFYLPEYNCWVKASDLHKGYSLLCADGNVKTVQNVTLCTTEMLVDVYNFTVENTHTYFVGYNGILVHNDCTTKELRTKWGGDKAQKKAVADEIRAIRNGTSKNMNLYSKDFIKKIADQSLTDAQAIAKFRGEFAAHHIITLERINALGLDKTLAANPNNLIVLRTFEHSQAGSSVAVHQLFGGVGRGGSISMTSGYFKYLIKLRPAFSAQISQMAGIVGVVL